MKAKDYFTKENNIGLVRNSFKDLEKEIIYNHEK